MVCEGTASPSGLKWQEYLDAAKTTSSVTSPVFCASSIGQRMSRRPRKGVVANPDVDSEARGHGCSLLDFGLPVALVRASPSVAAARLESALPIAQSVGTCRTQRCWQDHLFPPASTLRSPVLD